MYFVPFICAMIGNMNVLFTDTYRLLLVLQLLLLGKLNMKGVVRPLYPEIYTPGTVLGSISYIVSSNI